MRGRQLCGFKFVRQEPIDRYYVDFVCRERRLIIELDGAANTWKARKMNSATASCAPSVIA